MPPREVVESFLGCFWDSAGPSCGRPHLYWWESFSKRRIELLICKELQQSFLCFSVILPSTSGMSNAEEEFCTAVTFLYPWGWIWNGGQWKSFYKDFLLTINLKCIHVLGLLNSVWHVGLYCLAIFKFSALLMHLRNKHHNVHVTIGSQVICASSELFNLNYSLKYYL